jgi:hypothetical protein
VLNQKLLPKFKKWCKFSSSIKAKSHKKQSHKTKTCLQVNYVGFKAFKMSVDRKIVFRLLIPRTKILSDVAGGMEREKKPPPTSLITSVSTWILQYLPGCNS